MSSEIDKLKLTRLSESYARKDDRALVAACLKHDKHAWEALIKRYQGIIFSVAVRRGLSKSDAEDVFQNVCVKLYNHLSDLRDLDRVGAWLASVTARECAQIFRRESPRLLSDTVEEGDDSERFVSIHASEVLTPEEEVLEVERRLEIQETIMDLSEECRKLLSMLYTGEDGESYAGIAEKLSIPVGSIGPRRARCLAKLRAMLDRRGF